MRLLLCLVLASAGCLGSANNSPDGSVQLDQGPGPDLFGVNADLTGYLDCLALNMKEKMCAPGNGMCVAGLREMATQTAVNLDIALQQCFQTYCPITNATDMAQICTPVPDGTGGYKYSDACVTCINNTIQADPTKCNPPSSTECTKCYNQALACAQDTT
jgi:hypothetical protein